MDNQLSGQMVNQYAYQMYRKYACQMFNRSDDQMSKQFAGQLSNRHTGQMFDRYAGQMSDKYSGQMSNHNAVQMANTHANPSFHHTDTTRKLSAFSGQATSSRLGQGESNFSGQQTTSKQPSHGFRSGGQRQRNNIRSRGARGTSRTTEQVWKVEETTFHSDSKVRARQPNWNIIHGNDGHVHPESSGREDVREGTVRGDQHPVSGSGFIDPEPSQDLARSRAIRTLNEDLLHEGWKPHFEGSSVGHSSCLLGSVCLGRF